MNAAPYSEAKYNEVENVESSFEEDDWLLSDEEDEDNYRRPQNPKPKGQLERLQDMVSPFELFYSWKRRSTWDLIYLFLPLFLYLVYMLC